ncbi:aldehyde dehydrogenase family protein, partial [Burkholderia contaminans]|uniref:aldehyde dehydrogenase family protein n=1 Tax=Burkholderia contaminans TaxID=488447 RepID=UPI000F5988D2
MMEFGRALKDPALFRQQAYVNGEWQAAASGETFEVRDPSTGDLVGTVPLMGTAETRHAIEAANAAWPAWRKKTA